MGQILEITDFSGGVTDYHLNAPQNKMRVCDNLLLIQYQGLAKPFSRPGSDLYDANYPQIPPGAQRFTFALHVGSQLFLGSSSKIYRYDSGSGFVEVTGPTGNPAFHQADTTSVFTYSIWANQVYFAHSGQWYPQKLVRLSGGSWQIQEVGLPKLDMSAVTKTDSGTGNNWLYKWVYEYTYTDSDGVEYKEFSETSDIYIASDVASVNFTTIPVLSNSSNRNWDTANIKKVLYRTLSNGDVFFKVAEISNATTSYNDNSTSDSVLEDNETLYTTGGVVEFKQPRPCKIVHISNNKAYYAGVLDGTENLKNVLYQSVPGVFYGVPDDFYTEMTDEIIGVSSTKSNTVTLNSNSTYRIDGELDELRRGNLVPEVISDTSTTVNAQAAAQTFDGVFWAGIDAVYFTDGFRVQRLNEDYDQTYASYVTDASDGTNQAEKRRRVQAKYDRRKRRIWWTFQAESTTDTDICYVLDLNYGIRPNSTFTTISGASFSPTAIEFDSNGDLIRCDRRGYVLKHSSLIKSDPKIDTGTPADEWIRESIIYTLETIAYNFGTTNERKFVPKIGVIAEDSTNLSLQMVSINDDGRREADLKPIRYRGNWIWGEPDIYWGDSSIEWNKKGLIDELRKFPARNLRCNYKAIQFTNAMVAIVSSDLLGNADIDATGKTATLVNAATRDWPSNSIDYYIAFEGDNYQREYLITGRTDDVITYSDGANASISGLSQKWVIRGIPKNELLNLISYWIEFDTFGQTMPQFKNSGSGEVQS